MVLVETANEPARWYCDCGWWQDGTLFTGRRLLLDDWCEQVDVLLAEAAPSPLPAPPPARKPRSWSSRGVFGQAA
jgi:hypothetical protein